MSLVIRSDLSRCDGIGCRLCEEYLSGFFSKDGGITVVSEPLDIDKAELAIQFCPNRCITKLVVDDGLVE